MNDVPATTATKARQVLGPDRPHLTVLLVDDQPMVYEAVRRMLEGHDDIDLHYCQNPTEAIDQANAIGPTVILQDLVMPEIDGLTLVKFFRANEPTAEVPLIVLSTKEEPTTKAEAFALGANDYLVKLPDKVELLARLRYHSRGYLAQLERNAAYRQLADELAKAARYVTSLLPEPTDKPLSIAWTYIPSMQLGGDAFGYHWIDDDHYAIYLLDVCGHGVGAALLSVSAMNVLRSQSLADVDFRQPGQVLAGLNETFQMEEHNNMFFTIWYGVWQASSGRLCYASGGHHPATLLRNGGGDRPELHELMTEGMIIGAMRGVDYPQDVFQIQPGDRLYVYCDGVFEIERPDGSMWDQEGFVEALRKLDPAEDVVEQALEAVRGIRQQPFFEDDYSLVEVTFA